MENKRRFRAVIEGTEYTIVGNRSATHLNQVVELVNSQLAQLAELAPDMSARDRAILMSVNALSDQLVKEQRIAELEAQLQSLQAKGSAQAQAPKSSVAESKKWSLDCQFVWEVLVISSSIVGSQYILTFVSWITTF